MLFLFQCHDKFMHAGVVICHFVVAGQLVHHIVGIQHCGCGCFRNTFSAKCQNIAEGTDNNQEIGRKAADISDGMSSSFFSESAVCLFANAKSWQELVPENLCRQPVRFLGRLHREEWKMSYADSDASHQSPCRQDVPHP